ncbi:PAS domain S-box-containing protein [Bacillus mesophilus]|uniref:PAS domain S-box protein n=1 Tax=Bacillus mesophilus TaxID=1808955 RepID=A0A6M0Q5W2_9BACI|nr:PAS domain S-box protein [Bacillus mesophilus]MBM7660030.1 PAS domain S-box-containing protein [Bacillus mesophilus]NEY70890.1 PAS domain S-box protein [Bacillus mesophilus]
MSNYNYYLVFFSIIIAFLGSYTSFSMIIRSFDSKKSQFLWKIGVALMLAIGIWSMHFVGLLALQINDLTYDIICLILSFIIAFLASFFSVLVGSKANYRLLKGVIAGGILSIGIFGTHFCGMLAIEQVHVHQHTIFVVVAFVISLFFSVLGIHLCFKQRNEENSRKHRAVGSSVLLMLAIISLHYISSYNLSINNVTLLTDESSVGINNFLLGINIAVFSVIVLIIFLLHSVYLENEYLNQKRDFEVTEKVNHRLNSLLGTIPNGVVILNHKGYVTYINKMAEDLLSVSYEEVMGKHIDYPSWEFKVKSDDYLLANQSKAERFARVMEKPICNLEIIYTKKGKNPVFLSVNSSPLRDYKDEVILSFTDITMKKQKENELEEKSLKLEALFNTSSIGILLLDRKGNVMEVSPKIEDLLGYTGEDFKGKYINYFKDSILSDLSKGKQSGEKYSIHREDKRFSHIDGTIKWGRVSVSFIEENKKGTGYYLCIIEDLTKKKQIQLSNLQKDAELRVLQAQINPHFLFNTLNSIVSLIRSNQENARNLTVQLAKYMRSNLTLTSKSLIPLVKEFDHIVSYIEIQKVRFQDQLEIIIEDDVRVFPSDILIPPFTLQPLIENSIEHGLKGKPQGGLILVKASIKSSGVCISIEDNGTGITQDKLEVLGHDYVVSENGNGYGIYNVNKRLQLLIGDHASLMISNKLEGGAIISFCLGTLEEREIVG